MLWKAGCTPELGWCKGESMLVWRPSSESLCDPSPGIAVHIENKVDGDFCSYKIMRLMPHGVVQSNGPPTSEF